MIYPFVHIKLYGIGVFFVQPHSKFFKTDIPMVVIFPRGIILKQWKRIAYTINIGYKKDRE